MPLPASPTIPYHTILKGKNKRCIFKLCRKVQSQKEVMILAPSCNSLKMNKHIHWHTTQVFQSCQNDVELIRKTERQEKYIGWITGTVTILLFYILINCSFVQVGERLLAGKILAASPLDFCVSSIDSEEHKETARSLGPSQRMKYLRLDIVKSNIYDQENMRGQRWTLPVHALWCVIATKVIYRLAHKRKCVFREVRIKTNLNLIWLVRK